MSKNPNAPTYSVEINVRTITVRKRMRKLDKNKVDELAASIVESGGFLLQPIVVRHNDKGKGFILVAGAHRLAAKKKLGHKMIRAEVIRKIDDDHALLAEIDENLVRAELTAAERAQHTEKRKLIWEKLHPETKQGGAPGKAGGGKKAKSGTSPSFVEDTARKTGKSKRKVARDAARGKKVKVLDEIVGTCLDKGAELDALAALPVEEQRALAERAQAGEQVSAADNAEVPARAAATDLEREAADIGIAENEVEATTPVAPATPAPPPSVVDALMVLIERGMERGFGERYLPEFLAAQPKFDALDLIELSKWLKDFAAFWKAHQRRAAKVGAVKTASETEPTIGAEVE